MRLTHLKPVTCTGFGLVLILSASFSPDAWATVYEWRSANGSCHFSNDVATVPADKRDAARTFTSRFAVKSPPAVASPVSNNRTQDSSAVQTSIAQAHITTYERGLERDLQTAERSWRPPSPSSNPDHFSPISAPSAIFILMILPPSTVSSVRMPPTTPTTSRAEATYTAFSVDLLSRTRICHPLDIDIVASSFHADIIQETASCLDMA